MKTLNKERGITLIALVITIIVLLILAGVAISMLSGENGILNQAANAKDQTGTGSTDEAVKLAALAAISNASYSVDESVLISELDSQIGAGKYTITDTEDGWEIVVTKTNNHYVVTGKGEVKTLAWYYTEDGTQITNGTQKITLGDTIDYNPIAGLTVDATTGAYKQYESKVEKNGNSLQIFKLENNTETTGQKLTWKVLGTDEDGNILIMPTECIKNADGTTQYFNLGKYSTTDFTGGRAAAQYGAEEVNNVASIYGYGKGAKSARSVTEEDIAKIVNPTLSSGTNVYDYGNKVTYEWVSDTSTKYSWTNKDGEPKSGTKAKGFTYFDGNTWKTLSSTNPKVTLTSTYKHYPINEESCKNNTNLYNLLTLDTDNDELYWLGSSYFFTQKGWAFYGVLYVSYSSVDYCRLIYADGSSSDGVVASIRPAVSLKSDIKLAPNGANAWTIQ